MVQIYINLSAQNLFLHIYYLQKLVIIELISAIKTQSAHQTKDNICGHSLIESVFLITFEKEGKYVCLKISSWYSKGSNTSLESSDL